MTTYVNMSAFIDDLPVDEMPVVNLPVDEIRPGQVISVVGVRSSGISVLTSDIMRHICTEFDKPECQLAMSEAGSPSSRKSCPHPKHISRDTDISASARTRTLSSPSE